MSNLVEKEEYNGFEIKVFHDDDNLNNPRENDNISTMYCWHSRYNLGDDHSIGSPDDLITYLVEEVDESYADKVHYLNNEGYDVFSDSLSTDIIERIKEKIIEDNYLIKTLYLYDHSGITISLGSFSCGWDSGPVGFCVISLEKAIKEYNLPEDSTWNTMVENYYRKEGEPEKITLLDRMNKVMESEVKEYDQYIRGEVYGIVVTHEDPDIQEFLDGYYLDMWGIIGDQYKDECKEEVKKQIDQIIEDIKK